MPSTTPADRVEVDVVIVSHRTQDLVTDCVASAAAAGAASITVVDNASDDDTVELIRSADSGALVLANKTNVGYGAAANQGVAVGTAPYVLILNGDTTIEPETLTAMAGHLDHHPSVALLGPIIRRTDGSLQHSTYRFPSLRDALVGETGLQLVIARCPMLRERFLRTWSHDHSRPVDWVVGAAFVVRRDAFTAIGGFDEQYFMYSEEVDLCRRLWDAGHVVQFAPVAAVTHVGEASAVQNAQAMARERQRSAVRYLRIHDTPRHANPLLRLLRFITALRWARDVVLAAFTRGDDRVRRRQEAAAKWHLLHDRDLWRV